MSMRPCTTGHLHGCGLAPRLTRAVLGAAVLVCATSAASASATGSARPARICRVPRLTGLTLSVARERAVHAGCVLRVKGARLEQANIQTVARQSPARGRRSRHVAVWLNPFCFREALYGPELDEPLLEPGPAELVSGFFLIGGPPDRRFSDPGCKLREPPPEAGTVEVMNASGEILATATSTSGHFVEIPLPAGSYTITGTFLGASEDGVHPTRSESLAIPQGETVRQDFFLNVP